MKYISLLLLVFFTIPILAQEDSIPPALVQDSIKIKTKFKKREAQEKDTIEITIRDYKIISHNRDTTYLDTTLTIAKEYRYNYLRRDDFELMPFSNIGQPYNSLGVAFERPNLYPVLGASAKHFNYFEIEDISYYNVATPMTDLFFKTTLEQGQLLDASVAVNTSRRFNFSLAFKGFRSLGKYQLDQAESKNFRTTANYVTADGRYRFRAHIANQQVETEENGGILQKELQFESGSSDFSDRSRIDVFFTDADNRLDGKRYYLDHQFRLFGNKRDSTEIPRTSLSIGHEFIYESKFYQFKQESENNYFGDSFLTPIDDKATLKTMFNQLSATFSNKTLGELTGYINYYDYNYFFNSIVVTPSESIGNQLDGNEISIGGKYQKRIGAFSLSGDVGYTISGELTNNVIDANASYDLNDDIKLRAGLHISSRLPDFNFLLFQSEYTNYNWQNEDNFDNERVYSLQFNLESQLWGNISAKYTTLDNYTYFRSEATQEQIDADQENAFIRPFQEGNSVNHIKVKYQKELKWRKWAINNSFMYQTVSQSSDVLNVPSFVTRNTIYFSDDIFKKAMFIQTGITFKYFTAYNMNAYNPLLAEFYVQNREELGGFPMFDYFINAKVRTMRIYLKAEHFNSSFTGYNFYAAPNYPYRDFVIRFGLVWNFFS